MTTLKGAHSGPDASYYGDRGDWVIIGAKTRDADVLAKANWEASLERLQRIADVDHWDIETSDHWLVGHVDYLVVRPGTKAHVVGQFILAELADYPVLDEELFSQMGHDATNELWGDMSIPERVELIREHGSNVFAARSKDANDLWQRDEGVYYQVQLLATGG